MGQLLRLALRAMSMVALAGAAFAGSNGLGLSCTHDFDCFDIPFPGSGGFCVEGFCCESRCETGTCALPIFEGTCVAEPQIEPCSTDPECTAGYCVEALCCDTPCSEGRCTVPGLEGRCIANPVLEKCSDNTDCRLGFCADGFCCDDECGNGRCNLRGFEGICVRASILEDCESDSDCQSGYCRNRRCCREDCARGFCGNPLGECVDLLDHGSPCELDDACASGYCQDGRCCREDCSVYPGYCGYPDGVCRLLLDAGAICEIDAECATGVCDRFDGVCCRDFCADSQECASAWAPGHCAPYVPGCAGDCDGTGVITVDDLVTAVSIALGSSQLQTCRGIDRDDDGRVSIDEIVIACHSLGDDEVLLGSGAASRQALAAVLLLSRRLRIVLKNSPASRSRRLRSSLLFTIFLTDLKM